MATTKFIRVNCTLPAGVSMGSKLDREFGKGSLLHDMAGSFFSSKLRVEQVSTGTIELTLECPESKRAELAGAFQKLAEELLR